MGKSQITKPQTVRCAIYTRKSTEDGLEQEFNSLDAQRESGEAYIKSQSSEGWVRLPQHYDDGGFSGGNVDRPAFQRLLADIAAALIDVVVIYKIDRLTRSLLDFARMMETFEKHHVALIAVTQALNTSTSMGRLTLNVLMSFAQFEREIISERTRDKIAATRRKGKWSGGMPLLGYDVSPQGSKLLVNADEAARVRQIFDLYLEHQSMITVVQELDRRGWLNKRWTTRKGQERGGMPFTKTSLHKLLTNVTYVGKVRYKTETHAGEHQAIVTDDVWQKTQTALQRNGKTGGVATRNKFDAMLKGLLWCAPCGCAMTPSHATRHNKRYRYYVCGTAQKRGWDACPSKSIPAAEIEQFVVNQIRQVGKSPELVAATVEQIGQQIDSRTATLRSELSQLERYLGHWNDELRDVVARVGLSDAESSGVARLADLQDRLSGAQRRATEIREELQAFQRQSVDQTEVATALAQFDPIWEALTPREQCRVIELLVERVDYDGSRNRVSVTFHPTGIKAFGQQFTIQEHAA